MYEFNIGVAVCDVDKAAKAIEHASIKLESKTFAVFDFSGCDLSDKLSVCCLTLSCDMPETAWYAGKRFGQLCEKELACGDGSGSDDE